MRASNFDKKINFQYIFPINLLNSSKKTKTLKPTMTNF